MQSRVGPDRAGPFGILQTLADAIKLLLKEQILPSKADRAMYLLAPLIALVPSFLIFMIIPLGPDITVEWQNALYTIPLVGADLNVGVLYFLALSSIAVYSVVLAGWSSGSKYPLLGGVRASAQMISYEAAMGLALVPVILYSGSLSLVDIVNSQAGNLSTSIPILNSIVSFIPKWNIFPQFVAFGILSPPILILRGHLSTLGPHGGVSDGSSAQQLVDNGLTFWPLELKPTLSCLLYTSDAADE